MPATINHLHNIIALPNGKINKYHPLVFSAKANANPNILTHRDAMKSHDKDKFMATMEEEIQCMIKTDAFEVAPCSVIPNNQCVLRVVWSHRRKQKPTGKIYQHCSHVCADSSRQQYRIDYNETYSPVVQWSTAHLLMTLSILKGWKFCKADYAQAFP
eukprot:15358212-Ditylum_brightwellii.AAC.2